MLNLPAIFDINKKKRTLKSTTYVSFRKTFYMINSTVKKNVTMDKFRNLFCVSFIALLSILIEAKHKFDVI